MSFTNDENCWRTNLDLKATFISGRYLRYFFFRDNLFFSEVEKLSKVVEGIAIQSEFHVFLVSL